MGMFMSAFMKDVVRFAAVVVALGLFVSCSPGGSGGAGGGTDVISQVLGVIISPAGESFVSGPGFVDFILTDTNQGADTAVYDITLFDDSGANTAIDQGVGLTAQGGSVHWVCGVSLAANRPYYWSFKATYANGDVKDSGTLVFRVPTGDGMRAMSPRNGGYVDINTAQSPSLAVVNYYTHGDVDISYDFEIATNPEMTALVAAENGVSQSTDDNWTGWYPDSGSFTAGSAESGAQSLLQDRVYYWRARVNSGIYTQQWSDPFVFTVKDVCQVGGSRYVEHVSGWTVARSCDALIRTDSSQVLGAPNAGGYVSNSSPGWGFMSIDSGGSIVVEMGKTVLDGSGDDIRVFEYVSTEPVEVAAGFSEIGPWYSMGVQWCGDYCDFDLGAAGVGYARYFKITDMASVSGSCHATSGADIDAVMSLHMASSSSQCYR